MAVAFILFRKGPNPTLSRQGPERRAAWRAPAHLIAAALVSGLCATPSLAQTTVHPGDVTINGDLTIDNGNGVGSLYAEHSSVIDGSLCLGNTCSPSETFPNDVTLRLQYTQNSIEFVDTSSSTSPDRDWTLRVNDPNSVATGGIDRFSVEDDTAGTTPFTIAGGVPDNAFWLATSGDLGLGTSLPQANLHIIDSAPRILIEQSGTKAVREMFAMKNNGGAYFTLTNTDANASWYYVHENNAPNRFMINHSDGGVQLALTRTGDMTLMGTLYTAGFCISGCDRVFDEDYPLPTIAQQAAMMREKRHLPAVGPTPEDGPFNIGAMTGGMLNELEKAHLYIAQLHAENAAQEKRIARLEALVDALALAD